MNGEKGKSRILTSNDLASVLFPALGVPLKNCRRAAIYFEAGRELVVEAEYFAETSDGPLDEVLGLISKEYEVVKR